MLVGEKIVLGPLTANDAAPLFHWLNDAQIARSNGDWKPTDGMAFSTWFAALGKDRVRVYFAVRARADNRLIGYLSLRDIHPTFRSAELGITIAAPADRGRGFGSEAVRLAMDYCWRQLDLERVTLHIYGSNERALRCYRDAGFVEEGVMRRAAYFDGQRVDITIMGALRPR